MATQDKWLAHGLDPDLKSQRTANYIKTLRRDLLKVAEACGVEHPAMIGPDSVEILDMLADGKLLDQVYAYQPGWGFPSDSDLRDVIALMQRADEEELETEGPPETAEDGERGDALVGDTTAMG